MPTITDVRSSGVISNSMRSDRQSKEHNDTEGLSVKRQMAVTGKEQTL
jgi:hypothetical protein